MGVSVHNMRSKNRSQYSERTALLSTEHVELDTFKNYSEENSGNVWRFITHSIFMCDYVTRILLVVTYFFLFGSVVSAFCSCVHRLPIWSKVPNYILLKIVMRKFYTFNATKLLYHITMVQMILYIMFLKTSRRIYFSVM